MEVRKWPSICDTSLVSIPFCRARTAQVCRRSAKRMWSRPASFDDLIVHPAHHLGRVGLLCSWVHEHERTAGVPGVFQAQGPLNLPVRLMVLVPPSYSTSSRRSTARFSRDGQRPLLCIQVAPFQRDQLSLPKPRRQCQQEHGGGGPAAQPRPDSPPPSAGVSTLALTFWAVDSGNARAGLSVIRPSRMAWSRHCWSRRWICRMVCSPRPGYSGLSGR